MLRANHRGPGRAHPDGVAAVKVGSLFSETRTSSLVAAVASLVLLGTMLGIVFSHPANLSRLFVGGDGAYVRTLVRQQYQWYGYGTGNLWNFWQGLANVFPYNATGTLTYAWQTWLFGHGDIDPLLSHATSSICLFLSAYLAASLLGFPLGYRLLAGWTLALLGVPFFGDWELYPGLLTNPQYSELILGEMIVLRLFHVIGRTGRVTSLVAVVTIVLVLTHKAFFNSLHFVVIVPVAVSYVVLFAATATGRERRAKLVCMGVIGICLVAIGVPQFLLGNMLYSISGMLMADTDPAQTTLEFVSILFYYTTYGKLLSPLLVVSGATGAVLTAAFGGSPARRIALVLLGFLTVYVGGGSLLPGSAWTGPMPVYFEMALYPFYAAFAAGAVRSVLTRLAALAVTAGGWLRWTGADRRRGAFPRALGVALLFLPVSLLPSATGVAWPGFPYPPRHTELTRTLQDEIALEPGTPFRGYVAPFVGFKDRPPGDPAMDPYVDAELPLAWATGNDHRSIGLWYFGIPTLIEISSLATPPFFVIGSRLLTRFGDPQFRHGVKFTKVDVPWLQTLGVRFVISDFVVGEPALLRQTLQTSLAQFTLRLYELPRPNVGDYSPTVVRPVASATEILRELKQRPDLARTVVTTTPIPEPLVPATSASLVTTRWGLQVSARSPGRSMLLLPIQYTRCLEIDNHGSPARLVRANLLQTGLVFAGSLDARIRLRNGPFVRPGCRLEDWWDMKQLDILGATEVFPRKPSR